MSQLTARVESSFVGKTLRNNVIQFQSNAYWCLLVDYATYHDGRLEPISHEVTARTPWQLSGFQTSSAMMQKEYVCASREAALMFGHRVRFQIPEWNYCTVGRS